MTSLVRKMIYSWSTIFLLYFINVLCLHSTKGEVLFEYFPSSPKSTSDILRATLTNEDFANKIKILPDNRDVILRLFYRQEISLVYALVKAGPLSLTLSPCCGILKWELYWRSHSIDDLEIVQAGNPVPNETIHGHSSPEMTREEIPEQNRDRRNLKKKRSFGFVEIFNNNFTNPEIEKPTLKYIYNDDEPIMEVELNRGEGREPWIYQKEVTQPGLYIIKIRSLSEYSKLHALASRNYHSEMQRKREIESFKAKESKRYTVTFTWGSRNDEEHLSCLVVSRHKFYSSLCAARELQRSFKSLPAPLIDSSLILGCTPNTYYSLPATPNVKYYVSVWLQGSIIPFVQATIKAKPHRKVRRLRPGVMVPFTLTAGGQVSAKFHVRKSGQKLHVAAVSCYGGVKVVVLAGKERVAAARGKEALHLAVRHAPKAKLTIKVSPQPPLQDHYRVHLVVTHSARKLPIPRLPKNVKVKVIPLGCSSAKIRWSKSPGGATYCVVLQRHPSGRPPEIRPPLQCGWEEVIRRHEYFHYLDCFKGSKERRQLKVLTGLPPHESFLVNILVRHPVTGRTLTLAPSMLNLPRCSRISNRTTPKSFGKTSFNYKQNFPI